MLAPTEGEEEGEEEARLKLALSGCGNGNRGQPGVQGGSSCGPERDGDGGWGSESAVSRSSSLSAGSSDGNSEDSMEEGEEEGEDEGEDEKEQDAASAPVSQAMDSRCADVDWESQPASHGWW